MGYNIGKGNAKQFKIDGETLAFGIADDEFGSYFGLFRRTDTGEWVIPIWGTTNGLLDSDLTNADIMAHGSVAAFITAQFPRMQAKLQDYLGGSITKPDPANKPACVGYDLALDVDFDPATLSFALNKEPPLSHAR